MEPKHKKSRPFGRKYEIQRGINCVAFDVNLFDIIADYDFYVKVDKRAIAAHFDDIRCLTSLPEKRIVIVHGISKMEIWDLDTCLCEPVFHRKLKSRKKENKK